MDILNEATIVSYTGKKHEVLTRNQQDLLLLLGSRPAFPRSLLSAWNSHHRAPNSEYVFAKTLLELIEDEYISVAKVVLEPKPRQYHGVFTINPDGTATFLTDKTQYGPKLSVTMAGVDLDSVTIVARVRSQAK